MGKEDTGKNWTYISAQCMCKHVIMLAKSEQAVDSF